MPVIRLSGCTATPFGSYLKSLGVLRLVAEQADAGVRGWWSGDTFCLDSQLTEDDLATFFLDGYDPTPIVAPWNGGSGFYPKDNKEGIDAVASTTGARFSDYRDTIARCRTFEEVREGAGDHEDERRSAILRRCRNELSDRAVDWLDAAMGIDAEGKRSFPPVLGTGGNEGRLDYTNNFMSRLAGLLIEPDKKVPVRALLGAALLGHRVTALQSGAAGQYDPGRAGGANQGPGIAHDTLTNPWDLVLTLEGTVAWASGLYRRQGVASKSVLASPFTVKPRTIGYGSASKEDDARAEVWTPLWIRPATYPELRSLLREGRASVQGRPAANALEFVEAASSLGVDRGIDRFVRYSLLKRRGDSYVALPAGTFPVHYRREADLVRELSGVLDGLWNLPKSAEEQRRGVESAIYHALLHGGRGRMREVMAAFGRMLRRVGTASEAPLPSRVLNAQRWLEACGFSEQTEVRIAAAIASVWAPDIGSMATHLSRAGSGFAWAGGGLADRLAAVLDRRLQMAAAAEMKSNPLGAACTIDAGDATLFIEGAVDDGLIEDLTFAFLTLDWRDLDIWPPIRAEVLPVYAALKLLFVAGEIKRGGESKRLVADRRILSMLATGSVESAAGLAVHRLRVAGLRPLDVTYSGGVDSRRLAAALLIPVRQQRLLATGIFHKEELKAESDGSETLA